MPDVTEAKKRLRGQVSRCTDGYPGEPISAIQTRDLTDLLDDHDRQDHELAAYRAFSDAIIAEWRKTLVHWTQAWRVGNAIEELEAKLAQAGKGE